MSSQLKSDTARANGAKSHGPVTPQGRAEDIDEEFSNMQNVDRLAWVFEKLADHGQALSLVVRYEGALNRSYDRAFKQLHMLQSARRRSQPNEPKPDPDPAPASTPVTATIVSPIPALDAGGGDSTSPSSLNTAPQVLAHEPCSLLAGILTSVF